MSVHGPLALLADPNCPGIRIVDVRPGTRQTMPTCTENRERCLAAPAAKISQLSGGEATKVAHRASARFAVQ